MGSARPGAAGAAQPSPVPIFQMLNAFHQAAAVRAGIELDVFSAVGEGNRTAAELARRCQASERGLRILCDSLAVFGLLAKQDGSYRLTEESAMFLDRSSPAYIGSIVRFLQSPMIRSAFDGLTESVRRGGAPAEDGNALKPENPEWVEFARSMAPLMEMPSQWIAGIVEGEFPAGRSVRVLDIAAGHGLFGIAVACRLPDAEVVAVDWPNVLAVASGNAHERGVQARWRALPGDAFAVDFGGGFDVALITNFLHHFDKPTCDALLRRVRASLKPRAFAVALEFVPNDDRVSPPMPATFPLVMLATTPHGDAYTFEEYRRLFTEAGFSRLEAVSHPVFPGQALLARA